MQSSVEHKLSTDECAWSYRELCTGRESVEQVWRVTESQEDEGEEMETLRQGHAGSRAFTLGEESNGKDASGSSNASHVDVGEVGAERSLQSFRLEWWFI